MESTSIFSERVQKIQPSATLAVDARARELKARGVDLISFGAGEPDFDTPDNIKQAAIEAIHQGFTKYADVSGTQDLKEAILAKFQRDYGISYQPQEIIVSCGAKHSLYNIFQVLLDKGDEVLLPAPYWSSYADMILLTGARVKVIRTKAKEGFRLHGDGLKKAIGTRTKMLILNSPSNPTGACLPKEDLQEIGKIVQEKGIWVVTDDIYEKLIYDRFEWRSIASVAPEIRDHCLVVNGVSKAYAMTGWRIGFTAGPAEVIGQMSKLQSQSTSNPNSIAMKAAVEALNGPQESVEKMRQEFEKRRNFVVDRLSAIPHIQCFRPQGAFYVFPDVSKWYGREYQGKKIENSSSFAEFLIDAVQVAVVPGVAFGEDHSIRLSYAASMENIQKGLTRLHDALLALR
ncbi:MAG: pyridoxal phosphate-dependent aminotransferase [Deltaproteobacteria bacterium]|nr:pyridoxal phosphate-dependent aminotransferase [Deltaproteobacteria bacterium]